MILFVKLLLAHLLGDFLFQPDQWVKAKEKFKLKAWQLYVHALIHALLTVLIVWDLSNLLIPALVFFTHLVIDATKLLVQQEKTKRVFFFLDQFLHLIALSFIYYFSSTENVGFNLDWFRSDQGTITITTVVFLTVPASIIIKTIISKWTPNLSGSSSNETGSLESAGKYIGIVERLFVFGFVVAGQWEAVGFLIAAKSVFRFGDLKNGSERKLTEYVLIGTLISFGIAVGSGVLYNYLMLSL